MKRTLCVLLTLLLLAAVCVASAACGREDAMEALREELEGKLEGDYDTDLAGTTLYVYNWGEYISDGEDDTLDINLAFEAVTGIHVEYSTYDSNEVMYATLNGGGVQYDIVIPSDYMIARLIKEGRLDTLDFSKLTNFHYIDERYRNPAYDPNGQYSVPYAGGYLGVIYNNTMVDPADADGTWSLLWNEKYKGQILGIDNARDALGVAMYSLGIDVNTTDLSEWDRAAEKVQQQTPLLQGWFMDQIFGKMEGENAAVATYYAGDYLTMVAEMDEASGNGDHLSFYLPKEGTNVYFDAMCICADAPNRDAAHLYINFLLEPYIALQNAEYIRYTCPNTAVVNNDEYTLKGNEFLYPTTEVRSSYYDHLPDEVVAHYEQLWNKIKSGS